MDREMQALVDAPLANALKINIPAGRRPAPKAIKPVYEGEFATEKLTGKQIRERREKADDAKLVSLLDYYATTTVPFERIAEHLKLELFRVTAAMKSRGRAA